MGVKAREEEGSKRSSREDSGLRCGVVPGWDAGRGGERRGVGPGPGLSQVEVNSQSKATYLILLLEPRQGLK